MNTVQQLAQTHADALQAVFVPAPLFYACIGWGTWVLLTYLWVTIRTAFHLNTPKPYPTVWKLLGGASVVVAIGAHLYTLTTLTISGVQYVIEEGGKGEVASWSVSVLLAEATALSMLITATFIFFTFIARESFTHLNALYVHNVHANVRKINRAHSLYAQLEGNSVPDAVVEELDVMEVERQPPAKASSNTNTGGNTGNTATNTGGNGAQILIVANP